MVLLFFYGNDHQKTCTANHLTLSPQCQQLQHHHHPDHLHPSKNKNNSMLSIIPANLFSYLNMLFNCNNLVLHYVQGKVIHLIFVHNLCECRLIFWISLLQIPTEIIYITVRFLAHLNYAVSLITTLYNFFYLDVAYLSAESVSMSLKPILSSDLFWMLCYLPSAYHRN